MKDKSTKEFTEWNKQKIEINSRVIIDENNKPLIRARVGDIWWCKIGKNVGYEQDGKNTNFTRPVLIIRKIDKNLSLVIPTSTKKKKGFWYMNIKTSNNKDETLLLNQVKVISNNRLSNKFDTVSKEVIKQVVDIFCQKIAPLE